MSIATPKHFGEFRDELESLKNCSLIYTAPKYLALLEMAVKIITNLTAVVKMKQTV